MLQNMLNWLNRNTNKMILLFLIFLVIWQVVTKKVYDDTPLKWIKKPHPSGKYGSSNPGTRILDVIKELGKPDILDKKSGGVAIWKEKTLKSRGFCWNRIEIHDEQIPHKHPKPHTDFLYTWYKMDIPSDKINDVLSISDSIMYDNLKKMLIVRCHTTGANKATLITIKRFVDGDMNIEEAKNAYKHFVFATFPGNKEYNSKAEKSYVKELCK